MGMSLSLNIPSNFNRDNDTILVALSGGADSTALLHALFTQGFKVMAAHVNYGLRGKESDGDENFCAELCKKMGVVLFTKKAEPISKNDNIQLKAREIRYNFFQELCANHAIKYIATAHNSNDRFETLLMNISKGSGPWGFLGIPFQNGNIIRPILHHTRAKIEEYCQENNLNFRIDSSNLSDKYSRNKIRHHINPEFEDLHPHAFDNYTKSTQNLSEVLHFFKTEFENFKLNSIKNQVGISKVDLNSNPLFIKTWLSELGFESKVIEQVLTDEHPQIEWHSSKGRLLKYRGFYHFKPNHIEIKSEDLIISKEGLYQFQDFSIQINTIKNLYNEDLKCNNTLFAKAELLSAPIRIRKVKTGDHMSVYGLHGRKKISDILTDLHINRFEKESAFVLEDKDAEIIWLCGYKRSAKYLVSDKDTEILKIRITYNESI